MPSGLSLLLSEQVRDGEFVFTNGEGGPVALRGVDEYHFKPALERASLPKIRLYDLRHTCATLLLIAGEHPKKVADRLGHADVSLTLNMYSHVLPGMQKEGADKLNAMLFANEESQEEQALYS